MRHNYFTSVIGKKKSSFIQESLNVKKTFNSNLKTNYYKQRKSRKRIDCFVPCGNQTRRKTLVNNNDLNIICNGWISYFKQVLKSLQNPVNEDGIPKQYSNTCSKVFCLKNPLL